jgi:hypothetical protein
MKKGNEKKTKPSGPDVRYEHRTIIVARFRKVVEVTFGTTFEHVKRPDKSPTSGLKHFAFLTPGTFEVENTVSSGSLFKNRHVVLYWKINLKKSEINKLKCKGGYSMR